MGQKVNPHGLRVGIIKDWDAKWYADKKNFADFLVEDDKIRKFIKKKLFNRGIEKIGIERTPGKKRSEAKDREVVGSVRVHIHTSMPGIVIGRGGSAIEELRKEVEKLTPYKVSINIVEIKKPDACAQLVAENVALQLENRTSFRRAMKQCMGKAFKSGAKGIKVACAGRLGGAEMARTEQYSEGTIPLQTLRADIEYGFAEADTTYGKIGVKVWIYKGEVLPQKVKIEGSDN